MLCSICYHLLTVLHGCFSCFFKLYKWYQIMQSVSYNKQLVSNTFPYWPATENTFLEISIKMIVVGNLTGFLMDINT